MLDYAVIITRNVHQVTEATSDALRARGLSDEDIVNVAQVAGFFNCHNRLADALGMEPEFHGEEGVNLKGRLRASRLLSLLEAASSHWLK